MKPLAAIATLLFAALSHPAAAAMAHYSMVVGGITRTLYMDLPTGYLSSKPYPVIVILHGGEGSGARIAAQTNLPVFTRRNGVIGVYPDALPNAGETAWHDGRAFTGGADTSDVVFLSAAVDAVVRNYGRDPSRVFLGGSSSGGLMTLRMMCERTAKFRAYAVNIAGMADGMACAPTGPAPLNIYASTTDPLMPFNGGQVAGARGLVWSNQRTVDYWAGNNRCVGAPQRSTLPQLASDGTSIVYSTYGACGLDRYEVVGGGHAWPSGTSDARYGITTRNLDGTGTMIAFFRRFGL